MKIIILNMLFILFFVLGSIPAIAQQSGQNQMQQQMNQMQQTQDRMNKMMDRTHMMGQEMNWRMEQAQNDQMRNQFQMMHRFSEQLGMTLGNMKNAADRCELMLQDREMMRDREMQQEMEQMQVHLSEMTEKMDEAVQTLERMGERLQGWEVQSE